MLVISKAGEARGERTFRVRLVRPNGKPVGDDAEFRALFQNEESGANFILRVGIQTTEMGLYWGRGVCRWRGRAPNADALPVDLRTRSQDTLSSRSTLVAEGVLTPGS